MGAKLQKKTEKTQPQPNQKFSLLIILLTKKMRINLHVDMKKIYFCRTRFFYEDKNGTL